MRRPSYLYARDVTADLRPARVDPGRVVEAMWPVEGRWVEVPPVRELRDLAASRAWAARLAAEVEPARRERLQHTLEVSAEPSLRDPDRRERVQLVGWQDTPSTVRIRVLAGQRGPLLRLTAARVEGERVAEGVRTTTELLRDLPTPATLEAEVHPGVPTLGWLLRSRLLVQVRSPGLLGRWRVVEADVDGDDPTVPALVRGARERLSALLAG